MRSFIITRKDKIINFFGYLLITIIVCIYYAAIQRFAINIPYGDEYGAALAWVNIYNHLTTFPEKLIHLFHQANEHRILTYYLSVLADYTIFGSLNFKALLWVGNLWMIILFFLIFRLNKVEGRNPWFWIPVALLLFVPQHEISDWGIVALAAIVQYPLAILAMVFLNKPGRWNLITSVFFAVLTTFAFGNGMFIYISGYLILLLGKQKNRQYWFAWSLAMILSIGFYFTDYNFSQREGFTLSFLTHFLQTVQYFLAFFGSIFSPFIKGSIIFITIAGLFLILLMGYLVFFKWGKTKEHPVALAIILFIMLTVAAASVSRIQFGVAGATAPRYVLLQALFLALLYIVIMDIYKADKKWLLPIILFGSVVLYGGRLKQNFSSMEQHKSHLKEIIYYYYVDYEKIITFGPSPAIIKSTLDCARQNGVYTPLTIRQLNPEIIMLNISIPPVIENNMKYSIDVLNDYPIASRVTGWAFLEHDNQADQQIGLVLKSDTKTLVFTTESHDRKDVKKYFTNAFPTLHKQMGFQIILDKKSFGIPNGSYKIGVCILQSHEIVGFQLTPQYLIF
ncbi:MAG: hypothetical protein WCO13_13460 [Bacteroidota bacterium]